MKLNNATISTISHGTMLPEDLIPAFTRELEWLSAYQRTDEETALIAKANGIEDFDSQYAADILEDLFNALDRHAPSHCYFGAHEGDGSDYGFWPYHDDDLDI
jgi:hypothetical protein